MPWTPTTFCQAYPTFQPTLDVDTAKGTTVVAQALATALLECDARVFGQSQDEAVRLYASHLLAIDPGGQMARLDSKAKGGATSTYLDEWNSLARRKGGGAWTAGQRPLGPFIRAGGC